MPTRNRTRLRALGLGLGGLLLLGSPLTGCAAKKQVNMRGSGNDTPAQTASTPATAELQEATRTIQANFDRVFFPFDSAQLTNETRGILQENAALMADFPDVHVRIEGHTDEAGSDVYNLALGDRRAWAVYDYLVTLGVPRNQLERVSIGEYSPVVQTDGDREARNRRAEFIVTSGPDTIRGTAEASTSVE